MEQRDLLSKEDLELIRRNIRTLTSKKASFFMKVSIY